MMMIRMVTMDMAPSLLISESGQRTSCSLHSPYPSDTDLETPSGWARGRKGGISPPPVRLLDRLSEDLGQLRLPEGEDPL